MKKGNMLIFKTRLQPSQVKRHNYYKVSLLLGFTDKKIVDELREYAELCEKVKQENASGKGYPHYYTTAVELYTALLSGGQLAFLGYDQQGRLHGTSPENKSKKIFNLARNRDERRSALYQDKFFIEQISMIDNSKFKGLRISLLLKPSGSISEAVRYIKTRAKEWYSTYKHTDKGCLIDPREIYGKRQSRITKVAMLEHDFEKLPFKIAS